MYDWTEKMAAKANIDTDKANHAPVVLLGDFSACHRPGSLPSTYTPRHLVDEAIS